MSSDPLDIPNELPADRQPPPAAPLEASAGRDPAHPDQFRSRAWTAGHPINLRMSVPFGFGRFYLTIVAGRERRSASRRRAERRLHPIATLGNIALCAGCGVIVGLAVLALIQLALTFVLQQTGSLVITP